MEKISLLIMAALLLVSCSKSSGKTNFSGLDKAAKIAHCKKEILDWAVAHGIDEGDVGEVKIQLTKAYFDGKSKELVAKVDFSAFESEVDIAYLKMQGETGYFKYIENPGELTEFTYHDLDKL